MRFSPTSSSSPHANVAAPLLIREMEREIALPMPREVEGIADDPQLANPLQRQERLGTGWFGVILEWGAIFESRDEVHEKASDAVTHLTKHVALTSPPPPLFSSQAWLMIAEEMGYARPLGQSMRRIKGLRDDVVVTRVFNWTQNATTAKKVAARKSEVLTQLLEGRPPAAMLEAPAFLTMLKKCNIPIALASSLPEKTVHDLLVKHDLSRYFDVVVTAEDGGATEVEWYFMYSAQRIQRPPMRCIVVGESNVTVEASMELGMKCVVVAGMQPLYNFSSADLVVKDLAQLSFVNLKRLFGQETRVQPRLDGEEEEEGMAGRRALDEEEGGGGGFFMPKGGFDEDEDDFEDFDDEGPLSSGGGRGAGLAFSRY